MLFQFRPILCRLSKEKNERGVITTIKGRSKLTYRQFTSPRPPSIPVCVCYEHLLRTRRHPSRSYHREIRTRNCSAYFCINPMYSRGRIRETVGTVETVETPVR